MILVTDQQVVRCPWCNSVMEDAIVSSSEWASSALLFWECTAMLKVFLLWLQQRSLWWTSSKASCLCAIVYILWLMWQSYCIIAMAIRSLIVPSALSWTHLVSLFWCINKGNILPKAGLYSFYIYVVYTHTSKTSWCSPCLCLVVATLVYRTLWSLCLS